MEHISADLWDDPRFVLCAVQRAPGALEHAQAEIKAEPTFVLEVLRSVPAALPFVAPELLENVPFLLRAIERNGEALAFVPQEVAMDPAFVLMALRDVALAALRIDEASIEKVPKKFWTDRNFVLAAVRFQPSALNMVEPDWLNERKNHGEGVQELVKVNSVSQIFSRMVARSKGAPLPVSPKVTYNSNTGQGWTMWKDVPFSADSGLMSVIIPVGGSLVVCVAVARMLKK
eukprot:Skav200065  [mRNA]  locus=scaffold838:84063:95768:+ [translate_table: standard]